MSTLIAIVLIAIVALLFGWQWATLKRARRIEGQPVPDTSEVDQASRDTARVYYFFAAHCGPCRAVRPLVERLRREYPNLIAVDVERHMRLASDFGIAATPSFIAVADGHIREVKLGAVSESWLRKHLTVPQTMPYAAQR